jgi:uncharacterized protein (TIGR02996 family)
MTAVTEDELIAAIRADIADDRPRLVYADWLLGHDDPRGEIIQLQIRFPRRKAGVAKVIAKLPRPEWAGRWPPPYARGFASEIVVKDSRVLVDHIAEIRAAHPFAAIVLADGTRVAISRDDQRVATILQEEQAAGAHNDHYMAWGTTTAIVLDIAGHELYREDRTYEEGASGSGSYEYGVRIRSVEFSADGNEIVLALSDGTTVTRALPPRAPRGVAGT